jgi:hypothetical protein
MPITVERDPRRRWLVATATGVITIDMVLDLLKTARAPIELRMAPLLFDASSATTTMSDEDVETVVAAARTAAGAGPRGHVAIVADDNRFYALMLMYEIKCAEVGIRFIRVFRQRPDAEQWLDVTSAARNFQ